MAAKLPYGYDSHPAHVMSDATLTKGMIVGLIGGLVETIAMGLFGREMFLAMGISGVDQLPIIGDTAAGFFSLLGIQVAGGAPLGLVVYYLLGLALGAIFGVTMPRIQALHMRSVKKGMGLGALYIEVVGLPILATAPIILKMTASQTAQWFGMCFIFHLVYGLMLGAIVSLRLRLATPSRQG